MFHIIICRICSRGSVVRALRLISKRLPVLIQAVCFCPSGLCAPTLFKSLEYFTVCKISLTKLMHMLSTASHDSIQKSTWEGTRIEPGSSVGDNLFIESNHKIMLISRSEKLINCSEMTMCCPEHTMSHTICNKRHRI